MRVPGNSGASDLAEIGIVYGVPKAMRLTMQQIEKKGRYATGGVVYDPLRTSLLEASVAKADVQVAHPEMSSAGGRVREEVA